MGRHAVLAAQTAFVHGNLQETLPGPQSGFFGMTLELPRVVADFVPARLFGNEFVKGVADTGIVIKAVGVHRKGRFRRQRLAQGGAAPAAEGPDIGVWGFGLKTLDIRFAAQQLELLPLDEDKRCRAQFPAARTVARTHHAGCPFNCETHGTAAATA